MKTEDPRGFVQVLALVMVLIGLIGGGYLVQRQTNLFSDASQISPYRPLLRPTPAVTATPTVVPTKTIDDLLEIEQGLSDIDKEMGSLDQNFSDPQADLSF